MNLKSVAGSAIVFAIVLVSCGSSTATTTSDTNAVRSAQTTVDALAAAQPSGKIPAHFITDTGDFPRQEGDFDVNAYFGVLSHLSVEPGWTIDYLYRMDGMGGHPFIYARPTDRAPYASFEEYVAASGGTTDVEADTDDDHARDYLSHIRTDDTRDGYLELATLLIMGEQFYLYWHAGYNDARIVADQATLESLISAGGDSPDGSLLPDDVAKGARKLDLTPTVAFPDSSTATVRVVTFSLWSGFSEAVYTFSRQYPHEILGEGETTLIEYDCGVRF